VAKARTTGTGEFEISNRHPNRELKEERKREKKREERGKRKRRRKKKNLKIIKPDLLFFLHRVISNCSYHVT